MNVVLMNQRNCGGMDHCAPTLYNSSLSADVAAVARHVVEQRRSVAIRADWLLDGRQPGAEAGG